MPAEARQVPNTNEAGQVGIVNCGRLMSRGSISEGLPLFSFIDYFHKGMRARFCPTFQFSKNKPQSPIWLWNFFFFKHWWQNTNFLKMLCQQSKTWLQGQIWAEQPVYNLQCRTVYRILKHEQWILQCCHFLLPLPSTLRNIWMKCGTATPKISLT